MKTFAYHQINSDELSATDLRQEAEGVEAKRAYTITVYNEREQPHAEAAQALYLPSEGRLGIAWGADATWADVSDLESGIEMWLNDSEAWEANH